MRSYYVREQRVIRIPRDLISGQTYQKLRHSCYGNTPGGELEIPEVFWLEAKAILDSRIAENKPPAWEGIQEMLRVNSQQPGCDWETRRPYLKDFHLPGGARLYNYQCQAVSALMDSDLLLADDMGLGKTLSMLSARQFLMHEQQKGWRCIVCVPTEEVADEWSRMSVEHWGEVPFRIDSRASINSKVGQAVMKGIGIWIITYTKIWRPGYQEVIHQALQAGNTLLICDEAHHAAGAISKQGIETQRIRRMAWRFWAATGTECTGMPDSYHTMYALVTGSRVEYPDWESYFSRGLTTPDGAKPIWDMDRLKSIPATRGSYALRRLKSEVADLPPLTGPVLVYLNMSAEHKRLTESVEASIPYSFVDELQQVTEYTVDSFYARWIRLYQISALPRLINDLEAANVDPDAKLEKLIEIILGSGTQRTVVWCDFPGAIEWIAEKLRDRFPEKSIVTAHGRVSKEERSEIKTEFQAGEHDVLIANPKIWGTGVNLTRASIFVYWSLHPSRVQWSQSLDRGYRIGQTLPVTIYVLLFRDSIDVKMAKWLRMKEGYSSIITTGEWGSRI